MEHDKCLWIPFGTLIISSSSFSFLCPTVEIYVDKKFGKAWSMTHGIHLISFSNEFARLLCILSFAFYTLHNIIVLFYGWHGTIDFWNGGCGSCKCWYFSVWACIQLLFVLKPFGGVLEDRDCTLYLSSLTETVRFVERVRGFRFCVELCDVGKLAATLLKQF